MKKYIAVLLSLLIVLSSCGNKSDKGSDVARIPKPTPNPIVKPTPNPTVQNPIAEPAGTPSVHIPVSRISEPIAQNPIVNPIVQPILNPTKTEVEPTKEEVVPMKVEVELSKEIETDKKAAQARDKEKAEYGERVRAGIAAKQKEKEEKQRKADVAAAKQKEKEEAHEKAGQQRAKDRHAFMETVKVNVAAAKQKEKEEAVEAKEEKEEIFSPERLLRDLFGSVYDWPIWPYVFSPVSIFLAARPFGNAVIKGIMAVVGKGKGKFPKIDPKKARNAFGQLAHGPSSSSSSSSSSAFPSLSDSHRRLRQLQPQQQRPPIRVDRALVREQIFTLTNTLFHEGANNAEINQRAYDLLQWLRADDPKNPVIQSWLDFNYDKDGIFLLNDNIINEPPQNIDKKSGRKRKNKK